MENRQMARSPIQTSEGPLAFLTPTLEIVEHLARTWPMGMTPLPPGSPAPFGIVFQRGESEVSGVKIQQVDYEEKDARGWMEINRIGLGRALGEYMKNGYSGILIACPYLKKRGEKYEPGMAFFAAPDPDG